MDAPNANIWTLTTKNTYSRYPVQLKFIQIDKVFSQQNGIEYSLQKKNLCSVCKFSTKYHKYFPCK